MIEKIVHLADIHIRKSTRRNDEYNLVIDNLLTSLEKENPDRIVIVGDLVNDYLDLQGEQLLLVKKLLVGLSKIANVVVTRGNHDFRKKDSKRLDSVKAVVDVLDIPNLTYYDKTGVYFDDNVIWAVWHHGDKKNNPWATKEGKEQLNNTTHTKIDLFHDPVNGSKSDDGFEFKSKSYYSLKDFKGDYSFFGDIHKHQYLNKEKTKAYAGSLIAQTFAEGDDNFHGYLLWDIKNKTVEEISVHNDYSFKNVMITPFTDFDELDFEIDNPTKEMKIRLVWKTLPHTRNNDNERKIKSYILKNYPNAIISNKNEFVEEDKIDTVEDVLIQNINDRGVQEQIIRDYLDKIGVESDIIDEVIKLDNEITDNIDVEELTNIEWDIIKFGATNFMSYEEIEIDWRDKFGLFQITGINTGGKTTILKLISYLLYCKTLETEAKMKFGDSRYVNNRNGAKSTEAYMILHGNGEYYGIKRKTTLSFSGAGELNGAPTTLEYYLLSTADDELSDENLIENFDADRREQTQKKLNRIIGTYNNFMRIVMTTSDTLNNILSNNMADFVDSLLFDSGLDLFDLKLEELKAYEKKVNEKNRISCDVSKTEEKNTELSASIEKLIEEISVIETKDLPEKNNSINVGKNFVEEQTKKLFLIDSEIYNLNVASTKETIENHNTEINTLNGRSEVLKKAILELKDSYDETYLNQLLEKKENHKNEEYNNKLKITENERTKDNKKYEISVINGEIFRLNEQKTTLITEITNIQSSRVCYACGQEITKKEHVDHINEVVKTKNEQIQLIDNSIQEKKNKIVPIENEISMLEKGIVEIKNTINTKSLELGVVLDEIGVLTNQKNDVEKRNQLILELNQIPSKIENEELKKTILNQKLVNHENSLKQIEQNKKTEELIARGKERLSVLEGERDGLNNTISNKKFDITLAQNQIDSNNALIATYKEQERRDMLISLYKKSVHRNGIPRQLLISYVIPKINTTLAEMLSVTPFKVWLDVDDLRPKLVYDNRPDAVIDCISSSGKERTFSSVVLKFALNQINVKSKPTIFLLDEVMGKLDEESVEEFIEILNEIKKSVNKLLIIEQRINVEPDHLIEVQLDDKGISSLTLS